MSAAASKVENVKVIKTGILTKRSVVKRRGLGLENYKCRCFELTNKCLKYYDENHDKLKGSIDLISMRIVMKVEDRCLEDKTNVFQIVFQEKKYFNILYILTKSKAERSEWLIAISKAASSLGAIFFSKYHPGVWTKKLGYFNCCDQCDRNAIGCKCVTTSGKDTVPKPLPPVPSPRPEPVQEKRQEYIALFDFITTEKTELELFKGETYEILEKTSENWWKAKDKEGKTGFIPSNYVKINSGLEQYEWYYKDSSRQRCTQILLKAHIEGCFVVRDCCSNPGQYSLSVFTFENKGDVRHYHIVCDESGKYYISRTQTFKTIPELIHYHKHNAGGIVTRLREPPPRGNRPTTAGFSYGKWELKPEDFKIGIVLGRGQFGVVYKARCDSSASIHDVAIKEIIQECSDEFSEEVKTMTQLQHPNIVQLYGVILSDNPKIVMELLHNGALNGYLETHKEDLKHEPGKLMDFCLQICNGMEYLNSRKIIHRDLAARNCLVSRDETVKVGDLGLARKVLDDMEYQMSSRSKFPYKWSPPEVLNFRKYNDKSDVWSYGVLLWEIYSFGEMPYEGIKNPEVVKLVTEKKERLQCPPSAPEPIYSIMLDCWKEAHEERPSFKGIKKRLERLGGQGDYMPTEI